MFRVRLFGLVVALLVCSVGATGAAADSPATIAFASSRTCAGFAGGYLGASPSDIYLANADGSGLDQLTHDCLSGDPAWSPDGRQLAFTSIRDGSPEVAVMEANGSNVRRVSPAGLTAWQPAWSRTGRIAFAVDFPPAARGLWTVAPDGSAASHLTGYGERPSWSADGSRIAFTDTAHGDSRSQPAISTMTPDGSNVTAVGYGWGPAYSPDGKHLAWVSGDYPVNFTGWLTVANADGTSPTRIASPGIGFGDVRLAWSPDSTQLAYQSSGAGNEEIYVIAAAGGPPSRVTVQAASDGDPDWRPVTPSTGLVIKKISFPQRACATRPSPVSVFLTDQQSRPLPGGAVIIRGGATTVRATVSAAGVATATVHAAGRHRGRLTLTVAATAPGRPTAARRISLPRC